VWLDLEMTGLDVTRHVIVEVAVLVTDQDLEGLDDGLGEFAGKAWRIGLMGHSARDRNVTTLLGALRDLV
jgi:aspartate aminotransferase-like enzyme